MREYCFAICRRLITLINREKQDLFERDYYHRNCIHYYLEKIKQIFANEGRRYLLRKCSSSGDNCSSNAPVLRCFNICLYSDLNEKFRIEYEGFESYQRIFFPSITHVRFGRGR